MITKKFLSDESGLTVALESVLLFAISVIFLGMIFYSFQDMNQRQSKILMEEEFLTIGNTIAKQMSDLTVEARASNKLGSHTTITSEFWIPASIADSSYKVTLTAGKILLESTSSPYISVEVPVNIDINLAENSSIYSNDDRYALEYDSLSSAIYFTNGGVVPFPDFNAPTISIDAPSEGATINLYTYINVTAWDDVGVTRVEYYVNGLYKYSAGSPYNWLWDTKGELDGDYTVTAVAYDAAGHTKPAERNFTILNPFSDLPVINVIQPLEGTSTDFKRPIIKAEISDDKAIDFSSIRLLVDGINQTANISYSTGNPKLTTVTYTPSQDMEINWHYANFTVKDLNATPLDAIPVNRYFEVIDVTDSNPPTAEIVYPIGTTPLDPGSTITVTYLAYDIGVNESGIDNLTINVMRSDGTLYKYVDIISEYPFPNHQVDPQETWANSSNKYMGGMNYTYNITVFDRAGKSFIFPVGPLFVALPGQASELEVDTSGVTRSNTKLQNIKLKDNVSDSVSVSITGVNISWSGVQQIESVKFDGNFYWKYNGAGTPNGLQNSGTLLTLGSPYTAQNTFENMEIQLSANIVSGEIFTIIFYFSDTSTRTVTITAP